MKIGFNNDEYLKIQSQHIKERIAKFGGKLYMEFGGKLFDDFHASRVLPGFEPDSKIRMLKEMKDEAEIVVVINSDDIEKNKVRGDLGITYDVDLLRLVDAFTSQGLYVSSVVLTRFNNQPSAVAYEKKLKTLGLHVYRTYNIKGYPTDLSHIVSDEGFGRNDFIETTRPLVVVTAPGPGSGKLATCMSQLYHENKHGVKAGYAKFETFPVWNIPLNHPVNLAYEAATADLNDVNMIDPFHLEAHGVTTINYNRDVEAFPIVNAMLTKILGESPYQSPTDMGVNMVGFCIDDDDACVAASNQEIIRRYFTAMCEARKGDSTDAPVHKISMLMEKAGISIADRPVVASANIKAEQTGNPAAAMQMEDGTIITGKTSSLLGASSAMLLNALKYLAGIDDKEALISPSFIQPIQNLKLDHLGDHSSLLHLNELLIVLSIAAVNDPRAKAAFDQLDRLKGLEAHSSVILSQIDSGVFKQLGIHLTCEPKYENNNLYHK